MGLSPPPFNGVGLCRSSEALHPTIAFLGGGPFPLLLHFTLFQPPIAVLRLAGAAPFPLPYGLVSGLNSTAVLTLPYTLQGAEAGLLGMHMMHMHTLVWELCPCRVCTAHAWGCPHVLVKQQRSSACSSRASPTLDEFMPRMETSASLQPSDTAETPTPYPNQQTNHRADGAQCSHCITAAVGPQR